MTVVPIFSRDPVPDHGSEASLVDDKAWQHLGITGQEFRRRWYAGAYLGDERPEVQALDRLMRTGQWLWTDGEPPGGDGDSTGKPSPALSDD